MKSIQEAIAEIAVSRVKESFARATGGDMLRLRGLGRKEIPLLVACLDGWRPPGGRTAVQVVVIAKKAWGTLEPKHLLPPNASATTYRNNGQPCVFVEDRAYSDSQGLRHVRSITDSELLEDAPHRIQLIEAFRPASPGAGLLAKSLERVYRALGAGRSNNAPAVRLWADFVRAVCRVVASEPVLSVPVVWEAIGAEMPKLELLPEDRFGASTDVQRGRLLKKNVAESTRLFIEGNDREIDELLEKLEAVVFIEQDDTQTPQAKATKLKQGFRQLLMPHQRLSLDGLHLCYWEQVESGRSKRKGLGQRLLEEIQDKAADRIDELLGLDVVEGLDSSDIEAATTFLDALPLKNGDPALSQVISRRLRAAIAKVADPPQRSTLVPLRKLLEEVQSAVNSLGEGDLQGTLVLERRQRKGADDTLSAALFAWVYGRTLRRIKETSQDLDLSLDIDSSLCDVGPLVEFLEGAESVDSDENDDRKNQWAELRVQLRWDDGKIQSTFEWRPKAVLGLVALARVVNRPDCAAWRAADGASFTDWLASASEGMPLRDGMPAGSSSESNRWMIARREVFERLKAGLDSDVLDEYVRWCTDLFLSVRTDRVPQGEKDGIVGELLEFDLFGSDRGEVVMLASHPLRLRWVSIHLKRMADLIVAALQGNLCLNPVNETFFLKHLRHLTPHAQPAILVAGDETRIAVRQQDWHEDFDVLRDQTGERTDWLAELDDGAIEEIALVVGRYLDAYPHKADGLHILYPVRRRGARTLGLLLRRVSKAATRLGRRRFSMTLTLLVDASEIPAIERELERFDDPDRRAFSDFPQISVQLHPWIAESDRTPRLDGIEQEIDVAIVPNLFGSCTSTRESVYDDRTPQSEFDPWLDEPTRIRQGSTGSRQSTSVSRRMLPVGRDELLEAWSTVNVRQFRRGPVAGAPSPRDVDYLELQVAFGESAAFFNELHRVSHWVVTVDAFVGREQIEALESSPDVVLVRGGIGDNDAYRLVVSSDSGREFVVARLARRLRDQLPEGLRVDPVALALELYNRARLLVPGIVLRALGLGRTATEMVGVVAARALVDETIPAALEGNGFEAWISLDEHADWFGGVRQPRADLARIVGVWRGDHLELEVLVVEAKLRKQVDLGHADRQIDVGLDLLRAALSNGNDHRDADLWRRVVLRAIEEASVLPGDRRAALRVHVNGEIRATLDPRVRDAFRSGRVTLKSASGVLATLADTGAVEDGSTSKGHRWLRLTILELATLLERLMEGERQRDVVEGPPSASRKEDAAPAADGDAREPQVPPVVDDHERSAALVARYQQVISVLAEHKVEVLPVQDDPCVEGPGFYVFRVILGHGGRPADVHKLTEELKYGLSLQAGHEPRTYTDSGAVVIEVPKREEERYYVKAEDIWARTDWVSDRLYAPLGVDVRNEVVGVNFSSSKSPHLLIGGMTGGGKSVALETLLQGLVTHYKAEKLQLWLVDPKGNEFVHFERVEHVRKPVGMDAEDAIELLQEGVDEMQRRYSAMKTLSRSHGSRIPDVMAYNDLVARQERFPWIVVVLDEFADLTSDKDDKKKIEALLQRLAQKARACGIHAIVATQKPSADVISTTTRSNLGAQLALRVRSATDSRVIMETGGAESLAGNGDAFLRLSGAEPVRLQCAWVPPQ